MQTTLLKNRLPSFYLNKKNLKIAIEKYKPQSLNHSMHHFLMNIIVKQKKVATIIYPGKPAFILHFFSREYVLKV